MKGLHFAKPLEYRVEIPGDEFVQGKPILGRMSVTNRDSKAHKGLSLEIGLAYGDFKELKESGGASLKILERAQLAQGFSLKPGEEKQVEWEFPLGRDAPIRSSDGGPFLLYGGNLDSTRERGQLDLPVELSPPLATFITTLENHFAFESRGCKSEKGVVTVRLKPPGSYPALDELSVSFKLDEKSVHLVFTGRGKRLRRGVDGGVEIKQNKTKKKVALNQFILHNTMPNRALYRDLISTMLPNIAQRVEKKR